MSGPRRRTGISRPEPSPANSSCCFGVSRRDGESFRCRLVGWLWHVRAALRNVRASDRTRMALRPGHRENCGYLPVDGTPAALAVGASCGARGGSLPRAIRRPGRRGWPVPAAPVRDRTADGRASPSVRSLPPTPLSPSTMRWQPATRRSPTKTPGMPFPRSRYGWLRWRSPPPPARLPRRSRCTQSKPSGDEG
jgi:hypothetical protein